jgi:uncharacterized protein involved in exopolysaccharide biosynthesis
MKTSISLSRYLWVPVLTLLLCLGISAAFVFSQPPTYESKASIWETAKMRLPEGALFPEDPQSDLGTQSELLKSGRLGQMAVARLQASGTNAVPLGKDGQRLKVDVKVAQVPQSTVLVVTASSSDPAYARRYLDSLLIECLEYKKHLRRVVSGDTLASISEQVLRMERDLKDEQSDLTAFERTNNIAILQQEGAIAGSYLATLRTKLSDLQLEDRLAKAAGSDQDKVASRQAIQLKMENIQDMIKEWEVRVVEVNSGMAEAERLKQNVERTKSLYDRLVALLQNVDISRNMDQETLAILEPASPAQRTFVREKRLLASSGFGGSALGLGIIIIMGLYRAVGGHPVEAASGLGQDAIKSSAAERLEQIKALHEKGFINMEAYDRKVAQIIDSL